MKTMGAILGILMFAHAYATDAPQQASCTDIATCGIVDPNGARRNAFLIGGSYSEDSAYSVSAGAVFPVGVSSSFDFNAAYTRSPQELADTTTYRAGLGFDHDFNPVGVTIGYEYWGDREFVDTKLLRGSIYVHGSLGRVSLLGEGRDIDLSFDVPPAAQGFVNTTKSVRSKGWGLSARLNGDLFALYAKGMTYDYDVEVGRLSSLIDLSRVPIALRPAIVQRLTNLVLTLRRLNASSLTLANSFLDSSYSLGTDISIGESTLNVELTRDQSVTDGAVLKGGSVGFMHPVCDHCDIEYRVGVSDDEVVGSSVYGGITFYWYH